MPSEWLAGVILENRGMFRKLTAAENLDDMLEAVDDLKDELKDAGDNLLLLFADNLDSLAKKLDNVADEGVDQADNDGDLTLDELDDVGLLLGDLALGDTVHGGVDGGAVLLDLDDGVLDLGVDDLSALVKDVRLRSNGNVDDGDLGDVGDISGEALDGRRREGGGEEGGNGDEAEVEELHFCGWGVWFELVKECGVSWIKE